MPLATKICDESQIGDISGMPGVASDGFVILPETPGVHKLALATEGQHTLPVAATDTIELVAFLS
jgi:hypothetical protein